MSACGLLIYASCP